MPDLFAAKGVHCHNWPYLCRGGDSLDLSNSREDKRFSKKETLKIMVDTTGQSRDEATSLRLSEVESINGLAGMIPDKEGGDEQSHRSTEFASSREDVAVRWLRLSVISLLVICAVGLGVGTNVYLNTEEKEDFTVEYGEYARVLINSFNYSTYLRLWTADSLACAYTSQFDTWPNATLRDFDRRTQGLKEITKGSMFVFAPLVTKDQRPAWEAYATENNAHAINHWHGQTANIFADGSEVMEHVKEPSPVPWDVTDGISERAPNGTFVPVSGDGPHFPIWQINGDKNQGKRMMDAMTVPDRDDLLNTMLITEKPVDSKVLFLQRSPNATEDNRSPLGFLVYPVFDSFHESNKTLVGVVVLRFNWVSFFENILPDHAKDLDVVLRNSCDQAFTFRISGSAARYVSPLNSTQYTEGGDFHDTGFDDREWNFIEEDFHSMDHVHPTARRQTQRRLRTCKYEISVYPTKGLRARYRNDDPAMFAVIVGGIFIFCILVFVGYDCLVRRRHTHVVKAAERSNAIVHNLFPAIVRDRVITDNEKQGGMLPWRRRRGSKNNGNSSGGSSDPSLNHATLAQLQAGNSKFLPILNDNQKARLKTFLASDAPSTEETADDYDSEPIAELFNNTTVMFADIAGFTAWSSEREPSQVFYLLETLYRAFDNVASRLGVFKVETIGDCYVAVAGLPDPNEHHALIMTWFAYECLRQMKELIKELEIQLGPGTSDLALRVGLHSGPVIAGVLRGEKSRFQLFGDTMNTAARMESTGDKNLIHASDDTAKLLQEAGKTGWITPRDGVVYAKGKGEMQTYWLKPRRGSSRGASSYNILENSSCSSSTIDSRPKHNLIAKSQMAQSYKSISSASLPNAQVDSKRWGNLSLDEALATKAEKSDIKRAVQKRARLVDWNVELLTSFIGKIVAYRNQNTTIKLRRRRSLDKVANDSCRILEEVTEIIALPDFDANNVGNKVEVTLPPAVRSQLHEYVTRLAAMYPEHPFHNLEHASHVTMSAVKLMKRIINPDDIAALENNKPLPKRRRSLGGNGSGDLEALERNLYDVTFGISSDPLTQFSVVFSALIHDVDHRGVPNALLVQEGHEIAKKFGEKSAAEQNSVYIAWEMLMEPRYEQLRSCIYTTDDERRRFRQLVVNAVMATDIMDKDLQNVRKNRWTKAFNDTAGGVERAGSSHDRNRKATSVIEHVIQASDVAHTMQHWHIFRRWNERLFDEMYVAYKSGKTKTDPSIGWYEGQISFFDFYIIPLAQKLKECGVFGVAGDEYLSYARENRREWVEKGKEETEVMMVNFNLRYGFWSEGSDEATPNEGFGKIEEEGELLESSGLLEETSERTIPADEIGKRDIV